MNQSKILLVVFISLFISACASNTKTTTKTVEPSNDAISYFLKGKEQYLAGNYTASEASLKQALLLSSSLIDAHLYLGNVYFKTDRHDLSKTEYFEVLNQDPSNLIARNNLTLIYLRLTELSLNQLHNTLLTNNMNTQKIQDLTTAIKNYLAPSSN